MSLAVLAADIGAGGGRRPGYVLYDLGQQDTEGAGTVVLASGKILVASTPNDGVTNFWMGLSRWNSNGVLDTSYNVTGKYLVPHSSTSVNDECESIHLDSNNKIVLGGAFYPGSTYIPFAFIRLLSDGITLDGTFGTGGYASTPFNSSEALQYASCIQADGKLVGAGFAYSANESSLKVALARFTTAGVPDATFGTNGEVQTAIPGDTLSADLRDIRQQSDNKLVAAGETTNDSTGVSSCLIVRYTTAGVLDTTFNSTGILLFNDSDNPGDDRALCLLILGSGKYLVGGGSIIDGSGVSGAALVFRLNTDGSLDTTFATNGIFKATSLPGASITREVLGGMALQSSGKIVLVCTNKYDGEPLVVFRLTAAGVLDSTFGNGGAISFTIPGSRVYAPTPCCLAILGDDSILVSGNYGVASNFQRGFLLKLTPNGQFDTTFGLSS